MTEDDPGYRISLLPFDAIEDDVPTWAWDYGGKGRIAVGTMAIFAGRPGAGKSTSARWIAAEATRGALDGCWKGQPVNVAQLGAEESTRYIQKPGSRAAGADMSRIFAPTVTFAGKETKFLSSRDMAELTTVLKEADVKVVIVDPLMSTISGKTDINRNNEVRSLLEPWATLAEELDGIVIGIAHLNKSPNGDVVAGINGSSAFGEVARAVFGFAKDPENPDQRIMSQSKNSLGEEDLALTYEIQSVPITTDSGRTADFGKFVITGTSDQTVGDVLRAQPKRDEDGGDVTERDTAKAWLRRYLADKTVDSADAKADAKAAGFSERTVQRARAELGVVVLPDGRKSTWTMPPEPVPQDSEPVPPAEGGTGGTSGTSQNSAGQEPRSEPVPPVPPVPTLTGGTGQAHPTVCRSCNVALPAAATTDICDECDDPARQPYEPPVERPLYVVHDGKARREDARICPYCNKALLYTDDQHDGYHTSVRDCVTAHRKGA